MKTYQFLNELPISYLHVFTYSERPNTTAVREKDSVVPIPERRRRNKMLTILSEKKKRAFYQEFEGTTRSVLFEHENKDDFMHGYSDNYLRVRIPFNETLCGVIAETNMVTLADNGVFEGEVLMVQSTI